MDVCSWEYLRMVSAQCKAAAEICKRDLVTLNGLGIYPQSCANEVVYTQFNHQLTDFRTPIFFVRNKNKLHV
jgi:hypothetical protein